MKPGIFALGVILGLVFILVARSVEIERQLKRIDRDVRALCTHGESSVGPITIIGGHVTGSTAPGVTGCTP